MSGEPEPRRSVRATKGQHTKAFDQLENGPEPPKRRQSKKGKKAAEKDEKHDEDEEIIRCICGATTQDDDDTNEPWIACDKCGAWQHNVCMGMSVFTEDLTRDYFCEQCAPDDHKHTLEAMKKGERPWEGRRQKYEEDKKRKKGGRKGKAKRLSDPKDRASPSAINTMNAKPKASPTPDAKKEDPVTEPVMKAKRKSRDHSQGPQIKHRKISEAQAVSVPVPVPAPASAPTPTTPAAPAAPATPIAPAAPAATAAPVAPPAPSVPDYTPPSDLSDSIQKLEDSRKQAAIALQGSLDVAVDLTEKKGLYSIPQGSTKKSVTERLALEIERAFQDTHANHSQLRTLMFSLKNNVELASQVLNRSLPPTSFVVMTSDELATKELQRETAEMKARAEKQAILITEDAPRIRRTLKGEEVVEPYHLVADSDDTPSTLRRQAVREASDAKHSSNELANSTHMRSNSSSGPLRVDTQVSQQSPKRSDFDIGKVFSSVRSPSTPHPRRASTHVQSTGPGDDPEVDRLLQEDGNESPPYSPSENIDPDIVWCGPLKMTNVAEIEVVAKYAGGADLSKVRGIAWKDLIPPVITVCGRVDEEKGTPYLCGLRYNNQVDLVITRLLPSRSENASKRKEFFALIDYFLSRQRYGVVGEKRSGNVRDTYLVPVPPGNGPIPEPIQNICDHLIPEDRPEPMLLMVFIYRDEKQAQIPVEEQLSEIQLASSVTSAQGGPAHLSQSGSGPSWSPATPQGSIYSQTPVPAPRIPGIVSQNMPPYQASPTAPAMVTQDPMVPVLRAAQAEGEAKAREVLGPLFVCSTVAFLLPHAARMKEGEWTAVRRALERDPRSRDDLKLLSKLLTDEGNNNRKSGPPTNSVSSGVIQNTLAASGNEGSPPVAQSQT
ncbi:uncharacterized protein GGS25DRAFT_514042 [Hypoxylon fragiforme]|uniref:uncharacterized protein n=1 Tax=Hypoxylon fragiforme TaxID=63214 RepID=UPI0020C6E95E|nr:uncharacterized protein GGS25DRAFT_514042 [Hypoxylon fragiforme]KAI2610060.1 hypothetical protein GGS25DRAFT_514042 [Hypoxylon fragiforme]